MNLKDNWNLVKYNIMTKKFGKVCGKTMFIIKTCSYVNYN